MTLTKEHRAALLDTLQEAQTEREAARNRINHTDTPAKAFYEIDDWLLTVKINTIRTALIDDEIDY